MPVVNFFDSRIDNWQDVAADSGSAIPPAALAPRLVNGPEMWVVQTFHILRSLGRTFRLSGTLDAGAINVMHYDDLRTPELWRHFVVSARGDRDPAFVAQMEIVQNRSGVWTDNDIYIPFWPQPGLLPRDPARGSRIERLAYIGRVEHLADRFKSDEFRRGLAALGMTLDIKGEPAQWLDYRDVDVLLGVRDGDPFYLALKPASKVVNAWIAGVPTIVGPEHGYRELRQSPLDFFEAVSVPEVLGALGQLKNQPGLYDDMVRNGHVRAPAFGIRAVADRWLQALEGLIAERFEQWRQTTPSVRRARYLAGRARNTIWGPHAIPNPGGGLKGAVRPLRRTIALPGHRRVWPL